MSAYMLHCKKCGKEFETEDVNDKFCVKCIEKNSNELIGEIFREVI